MMVLRKSTAITVLLVSTVIFWAGASRAQSGQSVDSESTPAAQPPTVVSGHPFSAISFVMRVRNLPDGKQKFVRYDNFPFQIARDSQGRIRMQQVKAIWCPPPTTLIFQPCFMSAVFVFDPAERTITDWWEGDPEYYGHGIVIVRLTDEQVESLETSTSVFPEDRYHPDEAVARVSKEDLGEQMIEGVRARGIRTTVTYPAGYSGNPTSITSIHEVWISKEMRLVLRVVDGNPQGEETIAGLEHISLDPDMGAFDPPPGRKIWYDRKNPLNATWAIEYSRNWFVK